jgi:hypothetical protein
MTVRRPVRLALELGRLGADVVVVGGTARLLREGCGEPHDLDVVVEPAGVDSLVAALAFLGVPVTAQSLLRCRDVHLDTAWGPVDVFLSARPRSRSIDVDGASVTVAASDTA